MKNKLLWILLGGIFLIGAVFLLVNFRVAASNTQSTKLIFTTDVVDNMPISMQRKDKISIVLVGEGPLVGTMQKALTNKMSEAGMGEFELVQALESKYKNPVLVVKVGGLGPIWTPFFAVSQVSVHAGYASNGDTTFMEAAEKTHTSVAQKDAANMYAEYEVSDRTLGLISRPSYHQFLADYLAKEIVAALKDLYKG